MSAKLRKNKRFKARRLRADRTSKRQAGREKTAAGEALLQTQAGKDADGSSNTSWENFSGKPGIDHHESVRNGAAGKPARL